MRYTKGKRGPQTTNNVIILHMKKDGIDANPIAKGLMNVVLKDSVRSVSFLAQGKNASDLLNAYEEHGDDQEVTMRWTGREAVTITSVTKQVS